MGSEKEVGAGREVDEDKEHEGNGTYYMSFLKVSSTPLACGLRLVPR